jgi:hypothetical protein
MIFWSVIKYENLNDWSDNRLYVNNGKQKNLSADFSLFSLDGFKFIFLFIDWKNNKSIIIDELCLPWSKILNFRDELLFIFSLVGWERSSVSAFMSFLEVFRFGLIKWRMIQFLPLDKARYVFTLKSRQSFVSKFNYDCPIFRKYNWIIAMKSCFKEWMLIWSNCIFLPFLFILLNMVVDIFIERVTFHCTSTMILLTAFTIG